MAISDTIVLTSWDRILVGSNAASRYLKIINRLVKLSFLGKTHLRTCFSYRQFSIQSRGSLRLDIPSDEASVDLFETASCGMIIFYRTSDKIN